MARFLGGVVRNQYANAARLTVAGSGDDVARLRAQQNDELAAVVASMKIGTNRAGQPGRLNPYTQQLGVVYGPVNAGLGDSDALGDSSWLDVARTFVGEVGKGVASRISGSPLPSAAVTSAPPAWLMPAIIGGVALVAFSMLRKA